MKTVFMLPFWNEEQTETVFSYSVRVKQKDTEVENRYQVSMKFYILIRKPLQWLESVFSGLSCLGGSGERGLFQEYVR